MEKLRKKRLLLHHIATESVPFVPKGVEVDVFFSSDCSSFTIVQLHTRKGRIRLIVVPMAVIYGLLLSSILKSWSGSGSVAAVKTSFSGLLAITVGCGGKSHELYKESSLVLAEVLKNESQSKKLKLILDSLAIITFVGGDELEETERSMQSIWDFMHSRADHKESQGASIVSWSLLLSTMDNWSISYKHWQGSSVWDFGVR